MQLQRRNVVTDVPLDGGLLEDRRLSSYLIYLNEFDPSGKR